MRTLVDIPDDQIAALDQLAARKKVSRASLIREAVSDMLGERKSEAVGDAFGLWSGGEDGLTLQRRLRGEW